MSSPKVAILTPVYQHASLLVVMLRALQDQTYTDWECAVVFDGPDMSYVGLKASFEVDTRIRFHMLPERQGEAVARNYAARHTTAPALLPFDADDFMHPLYLERLMKNVTSHGLKTKNGQFIAHFTEAGLLFDDGSVTVFQYPAFDATQISEVVQLPGCSLHARELYDLLGGFDPEWNLGATDWMYWIRATALGLLSTMQHEAPLWYYRQHSGFRAHRVGVENLDRLRPHMRRALAGQRAYGEPI